MNCSRDLVEAYLDEELDAAGRAAVEQHLAGCTVCSETYSRLRGQKADIRAAVPYFPAPPEVRRKVGDALERLAAERPEPAASGVAWRGLAIAACLLLAASVSWNVIQTRAHAEGEMADMLVADHVRSLIGSHLVDVTSSDQHTVKPWFAGKLDFSPEVRDLGAEGFPLVGGRVEYLAGRRVAALVYQRRLHVINLFIWPAGSSAGGGSAMARNGYNLIHWTEGPMTYWAVSDLNPTELAALRGLYR